VPIFKGVKPRVNKGEGFEPFLARLLGPDARPGGGERLDSNQDGGNPPGGKRTISASRDLNAHSRGGMSVLTGGSKGKSRQPLSD